MSAAEPHSCEAVAFDNGAGLVMTETIHSAGLLLRDHRIARGLCGLSRAGLGR